MFYALFVTVIIAGSSPTETKWKTYDRFEECLEAATILVRGRDNITARCVRVESKNNGVNNDKSM
jgi:hypothetical protein